MGGGEDPAVADESAAAKVFAAEFEGDDPGEFTLAGVQAIDNLAVPFGFAAGQAAIDIGH